MFRLLQLLLLCTSLTQAVYGQDTVRHKGFGVETNFLAGKIVKHTVKFTAPVPPLSVALDINLVWQTYGKRDWNKRWNYPVTGLGIILTDYGNAKLFGRCIGAYHNIQVPIIRKGKFEWTAKFGVGAALVDEKYQLLPNYDTINNAVSTHLNAFAVAMTDWRYRYNEHWDFQAGLNFTHISNALYREPNLGINLCGGHVGARYFLKSSAPVYENINPPSLKNRWLVDVRGAIAHKEARAAGKPVKATYVGAISVTKRWRGRNKVFAGIDAAYHKDVYAFLINYGVKYGREKQHSWDGGFFVGNEFVVGRVGMVTIVGTYYRQTFLDFDPIYEKIGVKYYLVNREKGLFKEFFLSALLNTHGAVAEYGEFGMGVAF